MMEWRLLYVPKASTAEGMSSNLRSESAIVCGILCVVYGILCVIVIALFFPGMGCLCVEQLVARRV